jgi:hypothetical protein
MVYQVLLLALQIRDTMMLLLLQMWDTLLKLTHTALRSMLRIDLTLFSPFDLAEFSAWAGVHEG